MDGIYKMGKSKKTLKYVLPLLGQIHDEEHTVGCWGVVQPGG